MEHRMTWQLYFLAALLGAPSLAFSQGAVPAAGTESPAASQARNLTSAQLADLVAPVALFPDALLSQVLVASTYPLEVVQAQQWLRRNGRLKGEELMDAARQQPWDASVQGLVAFPDALATLNEDVQWTTELGNAFLAQESDVMAAVQRLRARAEARGTLTSTSQQKVSTVAREGRTVIEIVPADPQVIYVPQYDPVYVWGAPAWGAYPALSYGYGYGFGPGVDVGFWFGGWSWGWGWGWGPNWYGGSVWVNDVFFHHCGYHYGHHGDGHGGHHGGYDGGHGGGHGGGHYGGAAGGHSGRETWQHDASHRAGVPYGNSRVAGQYDAISRASRREATGSGSWNRPGGLSASSSGSRRVSEGSLDRGAEQAWRSGTRTEAWGARGDGTDRGWSAGSRSAAPGPATRGTDQAWRSGTRTEAWSSRGSGADRGWSSSGEAWRRSEPAPQRQASSFRDSAASPRYEPSSPRGYASSPRYAAPSPGGSAPTRSFSSPAPMRSYPSSAPTRGFQPAPRMSTSSGGGRSSGGGMSYGSGGGSSRGSGGGHGSGGGSHGGGGRH
mgnify:CR=1 FL=1